MSYISPGEDSDWPYLELRFNPMTERPENDTSLIW